MKKIPYSIEPVFSKNIGKQIVFVMLFAIGMISLGIKKYYLFRLGSFIFGPKLFIVFGLLFLSFGVRLLSTYISQKKQYNILKKTNQFMQMISLSDSGISVPLYKHGECIYVDIKYSDIHDIKREENVESVVIEMKNDNNHNTNHVIKFTYFAERFTQKEDYETFYSEVKKNI